MESLGNSGSTFDSRTSPSTKSGKGEQFNSEKKQVPFSSELISYDHCMPNATNQTHPRPLGATSHIHDQTYLQADLYHSYTVAEKGDGRPNNSYLVEQHANPFGEVHSSPLTYNSATPLTSQNPFLTMNDATYNTHVGATESANVLDHLLPSPAMKQENGGMTKNSVSGHPNDEMLGFPSPLAPYTNESSPGNPFEVLTSTNCNNEARTHPANTYGETHVFSSKSGDHDMPISYFPNHGQQSSDVAGQHSSVTDFAGTNNGPEKQNPPVQVMERLEDPATSSDYRFPSHVFSRHKSNTQWSTASNESLFSIQMGNTSFSNDLAWMTKSGELEKQGDMNLSGAVSSNQPPLPKPPTTKFNSISQSTAEQHEGSKVTEEKAAETMREVIRECSINKHDISKGNPATPNGSNLKLCNSINRSQHSDGSTKSFAFKPLADGDKTHPSKGGEGKSKQEKQSEQQTLNATPDAAQHPKSTPNSSENKWVSCFTCCS